MIIRSKFAVTDASLGQKGLKENFAVYVKDGTIIDADDFETIKAKYPSEKIVGDGKQLLMPGFIDAHTHGAGLSYIQRGVKFDFLENALLEFETALDLEPETNSMLNAVRHIRNGCTTIHHNNWSMPLYDGELESCKQKIEAYQKTGIRLAFSTGIRNKNILSYDEEDFIKTLPEKLRDEVSYLVYYDKKAAQDHYFNVFEQLYKKYNGGKTRIFFGPSWIQGSTDDFLQRIKSRADELSKIPIHIHGLQTPLQKAFGLRTYGKSLVEHLDDIGLVDSNLVVGHAVYLSDSDIELLSSKNASMTHHPSCNLAMRNGIAPVYTMLKKGLNVALGIDEKGINDDEDPIMEMKMIFYLHRCSGYGLSDTPALSAMDVIKICTLNGSRVTGFEDQIGVIAPGKKADVILIDLKDTLESPWADLRLPVTDIFVHRGLGRHVDTVIINGEIIMENRKILTVDTELLYKEAAKQASRGFNYEQKKKYDLFQAIKPYYQKWYENWIKLEDFDPYYILNSKK